MYAFSVPGFWLRLFCEFHRPFSSSVDGYLSRPRTRFERFYGLRYLLLRPARCGIVIDAGILRGVCLSSCVGSL